MRKVRALGVVLLFATLSTVSLLGQERTHDASHPENFVGAWRLVSLEEPSADGSVHKADCTGLLVYTRDGHISVQVMYRNAQSQTGAAAPVQYAQGGYEASFGKYEVDDSHTFTFHVEGALVRTLIGKDLKRVYELRGSQMIVKSPNLDEHWRVVWERE